MSDNAPSTDELLTRALWVLIGVLNDDAPTGAALVSRRSVIARLIDDIDVRCAFDEARKAAL